MVETEHSRTFHLVRAQLHYVAERLFVQTGDLIHLEIQDIDAQSVLNRRTMGEVLNNSWYKESPYPEGATAINCKECGACMKHCPQGINIPLMLKETLK